MNRRTFLQGAGAAAAFAQISRGQTAELEEATFADLSRLPARELTERYLARIREVDPALR